MRFVFRGGEGFILAQISEVFLLDVKLEACGFMLVQDLLRII